jgi:hypothetical protein
MDRAAAIGTVSPGCSFAAAGNRQATLGRFESTVAALCWLTNLGLIEKGRMIEIEAIYVSLFGFAFFLWLILWQRNRSPWLTFIIPWIFLDLDARQRTGAHPLFYVLILGGCFGKITASPIRQSIRRLFAAAKAFCLW